MKILIASDIHGSEYFCKKLTDCFENEKCDKMVLLGDILYHGPRNGLPKDYNPKGVASLLNNLSDRILCVRGNCDSEVDQMILDFPILSDYGFICINEITLLLAHGHNIPNNIASGNIFASGHTHFPLCDSSRGFLHINPGSASIPKENSPHSYIIFDGKEFLWKRVENGEVYKRFTL